MKFSILRLLIVMTIVAVWTAGACAIFGDVRDEYPKPVLADWFWSYFFSGLAIAAVVAAITGVWCLAGFVESFIRRFT